MVGAWNWDIQHNLVYCSAEFADYFSVDALRAASGAPIEDFLSAIHPDDIAHVSSAIRDAIATGAAYSEVYRLSTRSFGERTVRATGVSHRDRSGRPVFFTGFVADIAASNTRSPVDLLTELNLLRGSVLALKSHTLTYLFQALLDEVKGLADREKRG